MCLQYYKRHTYIKIFIVYLKFRFQWDILCFIWQAALLMPTRWISLPTPLASSGLHQFLRSSPSCPLSTWYSSAASSEASYGLWSSASVSLESSVLWMGLATCVPCLISGLLPQFLFIFSILPPETGVLPWTPVYLARTHTWFFNLANFLPGAMGLDPFSQLLAGLLTKLDGSLKPVSDAVAFLSCLLQRLNKSLK